MRVLFLKSFPGHDGRPGKRGGSAPRGAPKLPSSGGITDKAAAETYWREHFAGRTFHLTVKTSAGETAMRVSFGATNSHGWTRAAMADEQPDTYDHRSSKRGPRVFSADRAALLDRIFVTLEHPHKILEHRGRNVFLSSRLPDGRTYTVALTVNGRGNCEFASAYPRTATAMAKLERESRPTNRPAGTGTLRKSETPPLDGVSSPAADGSLGLQAPGAPRRSPLSYPPRLLPVSGGPPAENSPDIDEALAFFKALGPGERWITIHPHGSDEKGQPILIREEPDGSAKVIGGAGGALNHLRLKGVKSAGDYAADARRRDAERREAKKLQREQDKKAGLAENKKAARETLASTLSEHHKRFVETVAAAAGWDPAETRFPEEQFQNASPAETNKAFRAHNRELLRRARQVVKTQRQNLVRDAEARAEGGIGEVPLTASEPDALTVQDLDPVAPATNGLGFAPRYGERAEAAGLTKEELREEATAARPESARKPMGERVRDELRAIRDPAPAIDKTQIIEARKAVDLLKAEKALKAAEAQAAAKKREIDGAKAPVEPKAFVIEASDAVADQDVMKEIEDDLRTARTRGFLEKVGEVGGADSLGRHIAVGGYNSINALALAAGGAALLDRSAVDVLGIAGAAQVLARRLATDLTPDEMRDVTDAMGAFHVKHYMATSDAALREARSWHEMASEIEIGDEARDGADFVRAQELNAKRRDFVEAAQRVLGTAYGEMEANAALVAALGKPKPDKIQVSLGRTSIEDAVRQARALGLERGQYQVEAAGASTILTVHGAGMDKLAQPISREDLERTRAAMDIIEGRKDEDGWLPLGVAQRPEMAMDVKPGTADRFARPYPKAAGDHEQAIRAYIGARAADGDSPADIVRDLLSEDTLRRAGDRGAYMAALDKIAPLYDVDGQMIRAEAHQSAFEAMADEYVAGLGGDRTPLHRQQIAVDHVAVEALHQALAATPEGPAAFKPVGELTAQDQAALRGVFAREYGRSDPAGETARAELAKLEAAEPEREVEDMFGRGVNPAWRDWQTARNEAAERLNKSTMTWGKYLEVMGSPANAYAAMQDVVRGRVLADFAARHNTLRPDAPLRVGKSAIAHDLAHLDALDPAAREKRLKERRDLADSLRSRVAGRYAAGSVSDKLDAAREAEEAAQQAQMGLFGAAPAAAEDESPLPAPAAPELGERVTIGHAAERQIAGMMPIVGSQFRAGQKVSMWRPDMSGKYVGRQRAVKLIEQNKRTVLGLGVGSGKAQPLDAKVLTPTGWRFMGDLAVGDLVVAADGTPTRILGVYDQGARDVFRVTMADGGWTRCCDEHLWLTTTEVDRKNAKRSPRTADRWQAKVRSLSEIRETMTARLAGGRPLLNHHIPVAGRLVLEANPVPIDPYLLGLLLGDGCLGSNSVSVSSADDEIVAAIRSLLPIGLDARKQGKGYDYRLTNGRRGRGVKNALLDALRMLGLAGKGAHEKSIPHSYRLNSLEIRLAVLQGLLDTDGTVSKDGYGVVFYTVSERLRDDVAFLVRSLGGIVRVTKKRAIYTHGGQKQSGRLCFVLAISLPPDLMPFRLSRKSSLVQPKTKYVPRSRVIASVEPDGVCATRCIRIEHASHLYVTDDFIVTHNTSIMMSGFTHLQQQGKAKRGLFVVPSIVQGQFHGEALTLLEPGKFNWHCNPKAARAERIAAYKDPNVHFSVVTHQAFRDDMLHLASQREGSTPEAIATRLEAMKPAERSAYMRDLLDAEGIDHDYLAIDEGHNLLNRAGKADSRMATVVDAVSDRMPYYVSASGDPVKNDPSEAFDVLSKMDRARYNDRDAFMRRYGVDTEAARDGLRREMARHFYTGRIDPGVERSVREETVPLSDDQRQQIKRLDDAAVRARLARMKGETDIEALKTLSPSSFAGSDESQHAAIAANLNRSIGILHNSATRNAVNGGAKTEHVAKLAAERRGKPGVVFAHSLSRVKEIAERLRKDGHRVETLTGEDTTADKDRKKRGFQDGQHDIIVMSDAGAVGANLQRGQWLAQYDLPDTAMVHSQRRGRIDRIGQKNAIELLDIVADHPSERRARERLTNKYALRDVMTSPLEGLDDHGIAGFLHQVRAGDAEATSPIATQHPGGSWRPPDVGEKHGPEAHVRTAANGALQVADPEEPANDDGTVADERQGGFL